MNEILDKVYNLDINSILRMYSRIIGIHVNTMLYIPYTLIGLKVLKLPAVTNIASNSIVHNHMSWTYDRVYMDDEFIPFVRAE